MTGVEGNDLPRWRFVLRLSRRPTVVAVLAFVLLLAACSSAEPDARVVRKAVPTSSPDRGPGGGSATSGSEDPIGPADPAVHATLSAWEPCRADFECATLTVPRDWAEVAGETLELAVIRQVATGERVGSLVFNPGGPGGSGIDFLRSFSSAGLPDGLDERFDLVAWDPRGTGRSERVDCTTDEELLEPDLDPTPDDQADIDAIRAEAEAGAEVCDREVGDLLGLVGTRATVRDLDALRGALGDEGLSYVGYSYGTTIGMEYLRLYPGRVRAMVLDGVSVPGVDPIEDTLTQARGFERTLGVYLDGCAERPDCPLGAAPKQTLLDLVDRLEAERIPASYALDTPDPVDREGTVGPGELYIAVVSTLYSTADWPQLDRGLSEALADPPMGRTLLALRDSYLGREPDGTWNDDIDARSAIRCADQEARSEQPEGDLSYAEEWAVELPFWGAWFGTGNPGCWGTPEAVDPLRPLEPGAIAGAPPVVLIGSTRDPATPYEQSEDAQRIIEGSVLVTYVGEEHTAYRSLSDCIDEPVTAYLVDGTVPPAGLRCEA